MARVNITQQLINDVGSAIQLMSRTEIAETFPKMSSEVTVNATELATRLIWGKHRELFNLMPREWVKETKQLRIVVRDDVNYTELPKESQPKMPVTLIALTDVYARPNSDTDYSHGGYIAKVALPLSNLVTTRSQESCPAGVNEIIEYCNQQKEVRDIQARWDAIKSQVTTFLQKCSSLNEAVKMYPNIRLYVPKSPYLLNLDKAAVPRKQALKEKAAVLLDTEALTAAAIGAKLSGVEL